MSLSTLLVLGRTMTGSMCSILRYLLAEPLACGSMIPWWIVASIIVTI